MAINYFQNKNNVEAKEIERVLERYGITSPEDLEVRLSTSQPLCIGLSAPSPITKNDAHKNYGATPVIGKIVHYIDKDNIERPAIIAQRSSFVGDEGWLYVKAFVYSGADISDFARYSPLKTVRTWHWPEE